MQRVCVAGGESTLTLQFNTKAELSHCEPDNSADKFDSFKAGQKDQRILDCEAKDEWPMR